jgi:hypothetical protein
VIERFNFYDVYGYLLPGAALCALVWLPLGVLAGAWPTADWTSAVAAVVVSYFVGFVVQALAGELVPSRFRYGTELKLPSDDALADTSKLISKSVRAGITADLLAKFGINSRNETERRDAFFVCRAALIQRKTASYAEQFQALYALTRGLIVSSGLAFGYYVGWALRAWFPALAAGHVSINAATWLCFEAAIVTAAVPVIGRKDSPPTPVQVGSSRGFGLIFVALATASTGGLISPPFSAALVLLALVGPPLISLRLGAVLKPRSLAWCAVTGHMLVASIAAGWWIGDRASVGAGEGTTLSLAAIAAVSCVALLWGSYRKFAESFASTILRDYFVSSRLNETDDTEDEQSI